MEALVRAAGSTVDSVVHEAVVLHLVRSGFLTRAA
jgi:hypothetical protein